MQGTIDGRHFVPLLIVGCGLPVKNDGDLFLLHSRFRVIFCLAAIVLQRTTNRQQTQHGVPIKSLCSPHVFFTDDLRIFDRYVGRLRHGKRMRSRTLLMLACAALCSLAVSKCFGHPGSGIVVDHQGNVFFSDVSRGLLKVDPQGRVTTIAKNGGHWLALDANGSVSGVSFSNRFSRYKLTEKASLILGTDSPLVVTSDGSLCFVCDDERMTPGVRQVARLSSDGSKS